jgi:2-polyprenyl-6-methoxyphenol hydroxylase-like FAD-dependent oxidoreductase
MTFATNRQASQQHHHDVIIGGAGPVGLFLACELALGGCAVLILEREATPSSPLKRLPFGTRGLSSPSIEALHRRGLLDQLEIPKRFRNPFAAATGPQAKHPAGHFAGLQFHREDIDASQWPHRLLDALAPSLMAEMEELETVLTRRALALGVTIRRAAPIDAFMQTADGVRVDAGGQVFEACWLVGCDGARSSVRKAAGFGFAGTEPAFTGYSLKLDLADPAQLEPGRNVTAAGMYFHYQPGYLNLQDFDGGAFHKAGKPATREHVQAVLRRISGTGVTVDTLHIASTWTDRARQATSYRNGRVLLAGDAAHIHAPLGGQGLNLGLGDAMNLGWKLAAAVRREAPPGLLDSYEAERHPVGAQVLDWSRAQVAVMRPSPEGRALQAIVRDLIATRDGATYFAGRVWGVNLRYDLGDEHPLVGRSVPDARLGDGRTVGERLRDGRGLLLDADGAASALLAHDYGDRLHYVTGPFPDLPGAGAVLVRPDGIVAWAAGGVPDLAGLASAAARWFCPRRRSA